MGGNHRRRRGGWQVLVAALLGAAAAGCAGASAGGSAAAPASEYPAPARPVRSPLAPAVVSEGELDRNGEAARVAELLQVRPGQRVAELEAGTGYYALRFARALGPASLVQAVDADPSDVALIERRALDLDLPWVRTGTSAPGDPRLPAGPADLAIVADGYASIPQPYAYFARLARDLGGGRLAVVALDLDVQLGGAPLALVECELTALGYRLGEVYRLIPADRYLAVFTPPDAPRPGSEVRACRSDGSRAVAPG